MANKSIDELRRLADDMTPRTLWDALRLGAEGSWGADYDCVETVNDRLNSIADRIEREHIDALNEKIETICAQNREIDRLREERVDKGMLIEHGGGEDVDVAALLMIAEKLEESADYGSWQAETAGRIREAVEGAPKSDSHYMLTDRITALKLTSWMQELAELTGVEYDETHASGLSGKINNVIEEYRKTLVKIGCMLGYEDGELPPLPEVLLGELDKRLMPPGMEWPRVQDGSQLTEYNAPDGVFSVCLGLNGESFALIDNLPVFDETHCLMVAETGERIDLPEPEVLGADKLPIKVGDTVNNDYTSHAVAEVHASGAPYGGGCPWVRYTDGEWDFANNVTHGVIDTQERIDEDATMPPREYYDKYIGHDVGLKDDAECTEAMVRHLLNRQRELNARTMGGAL